MPNLHHIALPDEWSAAVADGSDYDRSSRGRSLADEGFIHCSYRHQVEATVQRFYADMPELLLLTIDTDLLDVPVVVEPAVPGGEEFPHIYGAIPLRAVTSAEPWLPGADGRYTLAD